MVLFRETHSELDLNSYEKQSDELKWYFLIIRVALSFDHQWNILGIVWRYLNGNLLNITSTSSE